VDEVLAVGDAPFQYKCLKKIRNLSKKGGQWCSYPQPGRRSRVVPEDAVDGPRRLRMDGPSSEVIEAYLTHEQEQFVKNSAQPGRTQGLLQLSEVLFRNSQGHQTREFSSGEDLLVEVHYHSRQLVKAPVSDRYSRPGRAYTFPGLDAV